MARPVTLFTGQWADLDFETMCKKAKAFGYDGIELACWGDHVDVRRAATDKKYAESRKAIPAKHGLQVFAISAHLAGQAVCDNIDIRHKAILPEHIWGDGDPEGVRQRAAAEMKLTAQAAKNIGVGVVNGFTGSSIWHLIYSFPPVTPAMIDAGYADFAKRWRPILNEFDKCGVHFALEVHPTEIAFDTASAERALQAVKNHRRFGFNFDPSHLVYQNVGYIHFLRKFAKRIFHVHMKDCYMSSLPCEAGVFGGHINFGDPRRAWDFRSLGRGSINFEEIIRTLNDIGYQGPLSVEWEDSKMDREHGAKEACSFVREIDFAPSAIAFDAQFDKKKQAPSTKKK
jgi:sugar phosphate isomerase/epimerase